LDHRASAIDMGRAAKGLSLLADHDTRTIVGRVEGIRLDKDGVLRGTPRFSRSVRGQEAKADFDDDIVTEVSVGYRIKEVEETGERGGVPVFTVRKWEPLEVSLVAVPADPTVGKGRAASESARPAVREPLTPEPPQAGEKNMTDEAKPVSVSAGASRGAEELAQIARSYKMAEALPEWIEKGFTRDQALEVVAREMQKQASRPAPQAPADVLDLSPRERKEFSVVKAAQAVMNGDWKEAGFERAVSEAIAKEFGKELSGDKSFYMPSRWGSDYAKRVTGQLDTATSTQGQELVFIEPGSFIELLRNKAKVMALGGRFLPGMVGNVAFPRQSGAGTFSWTGEAPTADVTAAAQTFDQLSVSPKTGQSMVHVSKRLLHQSPSANVGLEALIRSDIAAIHALAIDSAAIKGTGSNNQPTGIISTSGVSSTALGTNGAVPTYANLVDLFRDLAVANSIVDSAAILTTPGIAGKLMKTEVFASTSGSPVWGGTFDSGRVLGDNGGYRAASSNQVPSNLTKGTSTTICHAIIAGNFAELFIPEWGALEITVDPYTLAGRNLVRLISLQMIDVGIRHTASFKIITDALQA
jgi:HK97 family phage major capsid protein/HK97 family phage prohead protease